MTPLIILAFACLAPQPAAPRPHTVRPVPDSCGWTAHKPAHRTAWIAPGTRLDVAGDRSWWLP